MAVDYLVVDTDNRQEPAALQTKVTYAGDVYDGQPYVAVTQDGVSISTGAQKTNAIAISDKFGTTIGGLLSLSMMPDQISIGGGYWRLNPLLLSCIPSTTPTPIPTLIKAIPRLLQAKNDLEGSVSGMLSKSDAAR